MGTEAAGGYGVYSSAKATIQVTTTQKAVYSMHANDFFNEDFLCALAGATSEDDVLMSEPMSSHTTFKIGGPADIVITPHSIDALVRALDLLYKCDIPTTIVGNGSDLLVGDRGIRGAVVLLRENLAGISCEATTITAEAGALLKDVALAAADAELTGMEPLWGIPATVGGACFMNAGAYGGTTADVLKSVKAYVPGRVDENGLRGSGHVLDFDVDELAMGYRKSRIHDEGWIVLSATFALAPGNDAMIRADMDSYQQKREEKQPLEMPSAGSTFKRPEGYFAGKLIMDAGLRGYRFGGAQVSDKHCGFVVNADHATAADVRGLIAHVQDEVKSQFGVDLEPEVRMIGEF